MKKLAAVLLVLALMCSIALAQGTPKEEIIYALLEGDGTVAAVYAVNAFELSEPTAIEDYGAYTDVKNLTTLDALEYADGRIAVLAPAGRFHYQGTLADTSLPWNIHVNYTLDGEPVTAEALSGASGHLTCSVEIVRNPGFEAFTSAFTVQTSVTLYGGSTRMIDAPGATMAAAGASYTLGYVLLPGGDGQYTFSCDVSDFSMPAITFAGVRMQMNFALDMGQYQQTISTLTGLLSSVAQNAAAARDAAQALSEKLPEGSEYAQDVQGILASARTAAGAAGNLNTLVQGMDISSMAADMTASLTGSGVPLKSFLSDQNAVTAVQFVLMTRAIPARAAQPLLEEEAAPETFIDRIVRLFTGE